MQFLPQLRSFAETDIGLVRKRNEDRYVCDDSLKLYVVADGLGGHAAGDVAAELAVKHVADFVRCGQQLLTSSVDTSDDIQFMKEFAQAAVEHAAAEVHRVRNERLDCSTMGTTLTMLLVVEQTAVFAHVGDSRAYRIRGRRVEQLTRDHTVSELMIDEGMEPGAANNRYGHLLVRSIGHQAMPTVDVHVEQLRDGDRFLLCSDGVSRYFTDDELSCFVDEDQDLETIVENIIAVGKLQGGADNLTAVLVESTAAIPVAYPCPFPRVDRISELVHRAML